MIYLVNRTNSFHIKVSFRPLKNITSNAIQLIYQLLECFWWDQRCQQYHFCLKLKQFYLWEKYYRHVITLILIKKILQFWRVKWTKKIKQSLLLTKDLNQKKKRFSSEQVKWRHIQWTFPYHLQHFTISSTAPLIIFSIPSLSLVPHATVQILSSWAREK